MFEESMSFVLYLAANCQGTPQHPLVEAVPLQHCHGHEEEGGEEGGEEQLQPHDDDQVQR
jgi:hypothetical protein